MQIGLSHQPWDSFSFCRCLCTVGLAEDHSFLSRSSSQRVSQRIRILRPPQRPSKPVHMKRNLSNDPKRSFQLDHAVEAGIKRAQQPSVEQVLVITSLLITRLVITVCGILSHRFARRHGFCAVAPVRARPSRRPRQDLPHDHALHRPFHGKSDSLTDAKKTRRKKERKRRN